MTLTPTSLSDLARFGKLSQADKAKLLKLLQAKDKQERYGGISKISSIAEAFKEYPRTLEFFEAGSKYRERVIAGANQSGKSYAQYTEIAIHATGLYPDDWEGRRFYGDILIWCASIDNKVIMRIGQTYLMGPMYDIGSGMIPKESIIGWKSQPGSPNGVASVSVRRFDGSTALIEFKSYEAGRKTFQGSRVHVIGLDEEPPGTDGTDIYMEALTRTATTDGIVILTFTPLEGLTDTVLRVLPGGMFPKDHLNPAIPSIWVTQFTWDDAPHLTAAARDALWSSYPDYMREARSKGIPMIGAGKVYQILESDFVIEPFKIPAHWPKVFALDPGISSPTAVVWLAVDPSTIKDGDKSTGVWYLYDEHYTCSAFFEVHAAAIKRRQVFQGVIDPAALGASGGSGKSLLQLYHELLDDIRVVPANNAVEAGILTVQTMLLDGRLKFFSTCPSTLNEYRIYRRDKDGSIAKKQSDHALDALRYAIMTGVHFADVNIDSRVKSRRKVHIDSSRDPITGY